MSNIPNFLVVGAAKSGTSSLHYYLSQHPEIFMPSYTPDGIKIKEPMFLVKENVYGRVNRGVWEFDEYLKLFKNAGIAKAIGEATVFYLNFYEEAIKNIHKFLGNDVKIIIILRNPVERAYSAYLHTSRNNRKENLSFEEALKIETSRYEEDKNISPMTLYKTMGNYYAMVQAYKQNFAEVKIILFDDFKENTSAVMNDLFKFLEVSEPFQIDYSKKVNEGGWNWSNKTVKNLYLKKGGIKTLGKLITRVFPSVKTLITKQVFDQNKRKPEPINESTSNALKEYYRKDIESLSKLINKDLSNWLK